MKRKQNLGEWNRETTSFRWKQLFKNREKFARHVKQVSLLFLFILHPLLLLLLKWHLSIYRIHCERRAQSQSFLLNRMWRREKVNFLLAISSLSNSRFGSALIRFYRLPDWTIVRCFSIQFESERDFGNLKQSNQMQTMEA